MSDDPWREKLSDAEYQVLRQGATERPYTGEYWDNKDTGTYFCRACGAELFRSETKFDSRCGWPSFYQPAEGSNVTYVRDESLGMQRIEVRCGTCESHLGHVFEGEGFDTPTDLRYCINSISMRFEKSDDAGSES
ncbi:peptide-methionine (R)-S-oxide reductase MsrB [Nesterenkonia massiliensis]|uniref:peptide-methionine (R)-S-oxide reductase n=1 Tax=Nesterenkonia massiliensis TaxID=1232429 RepID=A0ABT2HR03_9MICC|nr:peptide-methionine (R)-S-oxide reductase MsrB [Nesterenkonia massiliensis]MCT1607122.1 peptide-methionine (R)-S-oxide reductase MsrB [Nesterenkonia massiliensis]